MKDSPLIIVAFLLFLFVLWIYTGGPSRPISFAGPYLTPITTTGQESQGYYDGADEAFWRSFERVSSGSGSAQGGAPSVSDGVGSIRITGGSLGAEDEDDESIELTNTGTTPVSITGWVVQSERTGESARIPAAELVARSGNTAAVTLAPGERALVTTGRSPIRTSFLETRCTGYLDNSSRFSPGLSQSCPAPIDELESFYRDDATRFDRCAAYVQTLPSCREARSVPRGVPQSCESFVDSRLSYAGCVRSHEGQDDFRTGTWRLFLGRDRQMWRGSAETILLLDTNGREVDRYAY